MEETRKKNWFKRHKILTVVGVIIVLIIIGGAASGGSKNNQNNGASSSNQSTSSSSTDKSKANTMPKIGQTANDGKFQFTVNSQTCGQASVGDQYLSKSAQGQYCILSVTVKNIGTEAQTFDASNQFVYDAQSNKLSADSTASIYDNNGDQAFLDDVNPGNSVTGNVVFDVPKTVTPVTAELHDSAFSGGVKVSLQ